MHHATLPTYTRRRGCMGRAWALCLQQSAELCSAGAPWRAVSVRDAAVRDGLRVCGQLDAAVPCRVCHACHAVDVKHAGRDGHACLGSTRHKAADIVVAVWVGDVSILLCRCSVEAAHALIVPAHQYCVAQGVDSYTNAEGLRLDIQGDECVAIGDVLAKVGHRVKGPQCAHVAGLHPAEPILVDARATCFQHASLLLCRCSLTGPGAQ